MSETEKWRVAHLGGDLNSYNSFVAAFEQAYIANGKPENMVMFSHNDSLGVLMGVSISPESIPYCPFSVGWSEPSKPPHDFGNRVRGRWGCAI